MIVYFIIRILIKAFNILFPKLKLILVYRIYSFITLFVFCFANLLLYSEILTVIKELNTDQLGDVSTIGIYIPLIAYLVIFLSLIIVLFGFNKIVKKVFEYLEFTRVFIV